MKTLVVIPTFNERENIDALVREILSLKPDLSILVVDDNSPDGTGDSVRLLQAESPQVHLLSREKKEGLGRAYLAGFAWALDHDYEAVVEMDADFSHRPSDLLKIVEAIKTSDFVVGSRYCPGGKTKNWGTFRKLISRGGSLYSRIILGYPLADWTGGFNAWHRETLEKIRLEKVTSNGYSFQIELKYRALRAGCRGIEVPIIFEERRFGKSKMSPKIFIEALFKIWKIRSMD